MEAMKEIPDKYFEISIVDPPYGGMVEIDGKKKQVVERRGGGHAKKYGNRAKEWDFAPPQKYFDELFRISKNQIIFGGNYFKLPPCRGFIVWDKVNISENFSFAMCEYAWTSFDHNAKIFKMPPQSSERFHPTQKPVALYEWILKNYAKKGDKILDTHVGSASSLIACYNMGFLYLGFEIDEQYYKLACERIREHKRQIRFDDINNINELEQIEL
jgi:site-specific DNA-methyltransferase (adenine-specific)